MALSEKIRMGVMRATGYAGAEAVRILSAHPGVRLALAGCHLCRQDLLGGIPAPV